MSISTRSRTALISVAAATALVLSGCNLVGGQEEESDSGSDSPGTSQERDSGDAGDDGDSGDDGDGDDDDN